MHFGHFKAGAQHDGIAEMEATLANISYRTGFTPDRWKKAINVMLDKGKGFDVEKLRIVLLFEADLNAQLKIMGRHMMANAEKHNMIAKEQYGSRKKHSSQDHGLNKALTFDILRQQRKSGAQAMIDAQMCYDRITHSVASLALQQRGLPKGPVVMCFKTLQEMNQYIRTHYVRLRHFSFMQYKGPSYPGCGSGQWSWTPNSGCCQHPCLGNAASQRLWSLLRISNIRRAGGFCGLCICG